MYIIQYDFLIEFFDTINKDYDGLGVPESKPKYKLETKNGSPEINLTITNLFSTYTTLLTKQAKFSIFNVPLSFNNNINFGDIVKIKYKKYSHEANYTLIIAGYLGVPMDTDYESGDFSSDYNIFLVSKNSFYNRDLKNKQFKGYTVENAIKEVFGKRAILNMNDLDKKRIIKNGFYARTPEEFIEKIKPEYVRFVNFDISKEHSDISTVYIFTNFNKNLLVDNYSYKCLEDYCLIFIPQQEIRAGSSINYRIIYWNAKTLYTHELNTGDKVSFLDRFGSLIKGIVKETSATLSNTGDCLLNLRIYDEVNDKQESNI